MGKEPGGGDYSADDFESLIGKKAACDIQPGYQIKNLKSNEFRFII